MGNKILLLFIPSLILLSGCESEDLAVKPVGQYFTVQVLNEQFTMFATDPVAIQQAIENFQGKNQMHPTGRIAQGDAGYNQPWNWHYTPETVRMAEMSIEVCDGMPSYVNSHMNDFFGVGYCPWAGKIVKVGR